ncbi:MAG: hypothetical protein PWQ35_73 [Patescibacteria group bacterium]|nr:hypothetical protein [Patescibacteria group bacterium]
MFNFKKISHKIKIFLKKKKKKKIKRVYLIIIIIGFIALFYILFLLGSVSSNRLLLAELNSDYKNLGICHEACLLVREEREKKVISVWPNEKELFIDWQNYWQEAVLINNQKQQQALLALIAETSSREEVAPFLIDYLSDSDTTAITKANIIYYFTNLKSYDLSNYLFSLLESENTELLGAIIYALTNIDKTKICTSENINLLKDFINRESLNNDIKLDALFLLRSCGNRTEVEEALIAIMKKEQNQVLLYFTIEGLKAIGNYDYPLPLLSPEDVSDYFNL